MTKSKRLLKISMILLQKAEDFKSKNQFLKSKEFLQTINYFHQTLPKQRITEIDQLIIDQLEKAKKVSTIVIFLKQINFLQIKIMISLFLFQKSHFNIA